MSDHITEIGKSAFEGCSALNIVYLSETLETIDDGAFSECEAIKELTLPASLNSIGNMAFYQVFGDEDILTVNGELPTAQGNTFDEEEKEITALLKTSATELPTPWSNFVNHEPLEEGGTSVPQCAKPTINYQGGKLKFTFEPSTFESGGENEGKIKDGVTIISKISIDDTGENSENEVELSKNYKVTAYAKKDGCRRSEKVTQIFTFMNGDVNLDGNIDIADVQLVINRAIGKIDTLSREFKADLESEEETLDPQ